MDLIDSGMGQPRPARASPVTMRSASMAITGARGPGQQIVQIIIHRIELQQADLILNKQLV